MPKSFALFVFILAQSSNWGCHSVNTFDTSSSALKIIRGSRVKPESSLAKATVALLAPQDGIADSTPFCTGVLIAPTWVLTVAHCATDKRIKVAFGIGTSAAPQEILGTPIKHQSYGAPYTEWNHFDIALIRLDRKAPSFTQAVPLGGVDLLSVHRRLTIAGYGDTRQAPSNASGMSNQPAQIPVEIASLAPMDEIEAQGVIQFAALTPGASPCHGDSGAPLFVERGADLRLVGLVVGGQNCHEGRGFATNVIYWQSWIKASMR